MARILLVDDEAGVRGLLKRGLELDGHTVETGEDGLDGLERLQAAGGDFTLLVSDIRMPLMDGIELAVAAKEDYPSLTIMLMTGFTEEQERIKGLDETVADLLIKPFSLGDFRAAVRRVLAAA
ncbi:MAG: response regulator [Chelatococcus sp.]|jgi:two-component system cell cycle response regulator CpdR|uniref:response regulator n=1 Tax=Chelatococcus sp. TaxID=1953771 RepID=UPI0025BCBBDF|nr:response regulator [Chelatococcus sp.]MBX3536704.1 response regulator [Chelatococcus sp.]